MTTNPPPAGFFVASTSALRREGAKGNLAATMKEGRLAIVAEGGGSFWIEPADIDRIRVGFIESKVRRQFQTRIWRTGGKPRLTLHPIDADVSYSRTIRLFAETVAASHGIGRVERGVSSFSAWVAPFVIGVLLLAALLVGFFILGDEPFYFRFAPAFVPALIFALLVWQAVARTTPRPIADLSELDAQLP